MSQMLTITRPDDWHLHLRDVNDGRLQTVVNDTAKVMGRAIVMPNLKPAIVTVAQASSYRDRILSLLPAGSKFEPLMTLYLTDKTSPSEIKLAKESGFVKAVKYYPAGATTNSEDGVTDIKKVYPALEEMQSLGIPLLVHGEVVDPSVDVFDREAVFIDRVLQPLILDLSEMKVVVEHVTTREAVQFVIDASDNIGATITVQHLLYNRNAMLVGGIRPHFYCLPVLKRDIHQEALIAAATSGNKKFFLGSDSAPHFLTLKENSCGCAGCYTAMAAIELYATAFEKAGAIDKLEGFASFYGADFYGLPRNTDKITLERSATPRQLPRSIPCGRDNFIVPFPQETDIYWKLVG